MKHIKKYTEHVNEMADITKKGKTVFADDKILKDLDVTELDDNVAFIYNDKNTFFSAAGKFWLYFVTDPKWIADFQEGQSDLLLFPVRTMGNAFSVSPITDVWKKSHSKGLRNADMIIGIVEGFYDATTDLVYVEMMSTRPGYKRNTINKKLIDVITKGITKFKTATLVWEDPTEDGLNFIKSYSGDDANFRWTIGMKPKNYKTLYPELADETKANQETGKAIQVGPGIKDIPTDQ